MVSARVFFFQIHQKYVHWRGSPALICIKWRVSQVSTMSINKLNHAALTLTKPFRWMPEIWSAIGFYHHFAFLNVTCIINMDESLGARFAINIKF
jgi:hypothetical protein